MIRQPFGHVGGPIWRGDGAGAGIHKLFNFGFTDTATSVVISLAPYQEQYRDFMIKLVDVQVNTNATSTATGCIISVDMSSDGGGTFDTAATGYCWQMVAGASGTAAATGTSAAAAARITPASFDGIVSVNQDHSVNGMMWVNNSYATGDRTYLKWELGHITGANTAVVYTGYGAHNTSERSTDIRFSFSTGGTYDSGFFELWAIDHRVN